MIDSTLVRTRRQDLRISQRVLARHVGVSSHVIANIEAGTRQGPITLEMASRIAHALAVDLVDLIARPAPAGPPDGELVGLLAHADAPVPVDALAAAMGMSLDELHAALAEAGAALRAVGLAIHHCDRAVSLQPVATVDRDRLEVMLRESRGRLGLNPTEARLLRKALDGQAIDESRLGNADTVALGVLRNAGMLTQAGLPSADVAPAFSDPQGSCHARQM